MAQGETDSESDGHESPTPPSDGGAAGARAGAGASASASAGAGTAASRVSPAERRARRLRRTIVVGVGALVVVGVAVALAFGLGRPGEPLAVTSPSATPSATATPASSPTPSDTPAEAPAPTTAPASPPSSAYDITTADSLTVLVNKHHPLHPQDYAPSDLVSMSSINIPSLNGHSLRKPAADALVPLFAAAAADGIQLDMTSGYRDFQLQTELYTGYIQSLGQAGADATSARPGNSEHQTGLAADISAPSEGCVLTACFADTPGGQWLAAHAWEYGWILRFPEGQTAVTGYEFEPWHYRFVGVEPAKAYHESGATTYEEFLGSDPAPDYPN